MRTHCIVLKDERYPRYLYFWQAGRVGMFCIEEFAEDEIVQKGEFNENSC